MTPAEVIPLDSHRGADGERARCRATTAEGRPCRNVAVSGSGYCRVHARDGARDEHPSAVVPPADDARDGTSLMDFARNRASGAYEVDDFGFDPELFSTVLMPLARPLFERYFRTRTLGVDRIPGSGPVLLVANHSGTIALDAVMVQYAVWSQHPARRVVRNVAANLAIAMPFVGPIARRAGAAVACDEDAQELLARGEVVGVFPEGYKGVGKGWRERYRLQRFGRGGFIELALRARVPIVPVAIVGAEEAYPMIADARIAARLLGVPYFPVTPTFPLLGPLGLLPLPSRWVIEFGNPIAMDEYADDAHEDAMLVLELTDRVRDTIQEMLVRNLSVRGGAFL